MARDIRGIGFKTADEIAQKLGIEKDAMIRARAGIAYALSEAMSDGHCGLPQEELVQMAEQLLEIPASRIEIALDLELQDGEVISDAVDDERCIFLAGLSVSGKFPVKQGINREFSQNHPLIRPVGASNTLVSLDAVALDQVDQESLLDCKI